MADALTLPFPRFDSRSCRQPGSISRLSVPGLSDIDTPRLRLGLLVPADAEALWQVTNDPGIIDAISFLRHPFTLMDAKTLIALNQDDCDQFRGIWRRQDNALVGVIGAHSRTRGAIEIGYLIGTRFQRQGYAYEAGHGTNGSGGRDRRRRSLPSAGSRILPHGAHWIGSAFARPVPSERGPDGSSSPSPRYLERRRSKVSSDATWLPRCRPLPTCRCRCAGRCPAGRWRKPMP
jgi:Acetyltransferase (GNAT) domain